MKKGIYARYGKRVLDVVLSGGALAVLSPVLAVTAVLVRVRLGKPVIFCQERPGKNERIFKMYKFRTMTNACDKKGNLLPDEKRLTPFGSALRKASLDELPELFNIFKGDMSIVGPRPLLCSYLPYYTEREKLRHSVMPGLTGLAQVNGRNMLAWDERLELDARYAEHITFLGDLHIILQTVAKVFAREGIAVDTAAVEPNLAEEREAKKQREQRTP